MENRTELPNGDPYANVPQGLAYVREHPIEGNQRISQLALDAVRAVAYQDGFNEREQPEDAPLADRKKAFVKAATALGYTFCAVCNDQTAQLEEGGWIFTACKCAQEWALEDEEQSKGSCYGVLGDASTCAIHGGWLVDGSCSAKPKAEELARAVDRAAEYCSDRNEQRLLREAASKLHSAKQALPSVPASEIHKVIETLEHMGDDINNASRVEVVLRCLSIPNEIWS